MQISYLSGAGILAASGIAGGAAAYLWHLKISKLPPEEALRRAIKIGTQIWLASDFTAPAALGETAGELAGRALLEAGLILKAEVMGESTFAANLSPAAARPHPELAEVDPIRLAQGVRDRILGVGAFL